MKKLFFLILFLDIIAASQDISFEQLKSAATEHSHRLKLRHIDTSIEEVRLESVYSTLYPQLSLGYNGEYNRNLDNTTSGTLAVGDTTINATVPYKDSVALRLNYELYHFGTTLQQIEMSKKEIAAKKLEQCNEETKLFSEILDHYTQAQKAQSEHRHKSKMHTLRKELYFYKQRLHTAGKESRISVGDEAIRLIDLERDIERSLMSYEENLIFLSKLSHIELDLKNTQLLPLATPADTVKTISFEHAGIARQYQEKILQKNAEITLSERSQLPVVSLYSNYYFYGSDPYHAYDALTAIRPNSWNAGVSIRWNLFEGFKYNSESARLHLELDRLREEYVLAKREFDAETQTRQEHINRLTLLSENETEAFREVRFKITMTQRLRAQGEADAVSEVSVKLEGLERELTLDTETIQHAYEAESLKLQHRGADECTPR